MSRELVIDPNREGSHYGTCEDEKIGRNAEAAARESGDEAAYEEGQVEGQRIFPAAERRLVRWKGREMKKWSGMRRLFDDIAIALLVVGYAVTMGADPIVI